MYLFSWRQEPIMIKNHEVTEKEKAIALGIGMDKKRLFFFLCIKLRVLTSHTHHLLLGFSVQHYLLAVGSFHHWSVNDWFSFLLLDISKWLLFMLYSTRPRRMLSMISQRVLERLLQFKKCSSPAHSVASNYFANAHRILNSIHSVPVWVSTSLDRSKQKKIEKSTTSTYSFHILERMAALAPFHLSIPSRRYCVGSTGPKNSQGNNSGWLDNCGWHPTLLAMESMYLM